jgi:type I restriction enzyme S subunit
MILNTENGDGVLFAPADQIGARLTEAQRQVDALTPSLLARGFAGTLVLQDPTDEPASVLLERIKVQSKNTHESRPRKRL